MAILRDPLVSTDQCNDWVNIKCLQSVAHYSHDLRFGLTWSEQRKNILKSLSGVAA
jgi:hypothetical protein